MVYIYGGSLIFGATSDPVNDPSILASSGNVVAVSINYRVNAFGFLALEVLGQKYNHNHNNNNHGASNHGSSSSSTSSGNYGFMDQILALQWIRDNSAQFGGDPDNVTIFGQSSGGTSVLCLLLSPLANGLSHKAFTMSSSSISSGELARQPFCIRYSFHCFDLWSMFHVLQYFHEGYEPTESDLAFGDMLIRDFTFFADHGVMPPGTPWQQFTTPGVGAYAEAAAEGDLGVGYVANILQVNQTTQANLKKHQCQFWHKNGFDKYWWRGQ